MSRGHHSVSAIIAHLRAEMKGKTNDQLYQDYGIVVRDNNTVYDEAYEKEFPSLHSWLQFYAAATFEEESDGYDNEYRGRFDDDQY